MEVLLTCVPQSPPTAYIPDKPTASLRGISGPTVTGLDGQTIADRMEKLCEEVAEDIEKCATTCDTYST